MFYYILLLSLLTYADGGVKADNKPKGAVKSALPVSGQVILIQHGSGPAGSVTGQSLPAVEKLYTCPESTLQADGISLTGNNIIYGDTVQKVGYEPVGQLIWTP